MLLEQNFIQIIFLSKHLEIDSIEEMIAALAERDFFEDALALAKFSNLNLEFFFKILGRKLCEVNPST